MSYFYSQAELKEDNSNSNLDIDLDAPHHHHSHHHRRHDHRHKSHNHNNNHHHKKHHDDKHHDENKQHNKHDTDHHHKKLSDNPSTSSQKQQQQQRKQQEQTQQQEQEQGLLKFEDIQIGEYLGSGSVNIACFFVTMPNWVYQQYQLPKDQKLLLKLSPVSSDGGRREIEAFRRMNVDQETARKLHVLPLLYGKDNMTNPFYNDNNCYHKDINGDRNKDSCQQLYNSNIPHRKLKKLLKHQFISALIIPYKEKRLIHDKHHTLQEYQHFLQSLLSQLAHAHSVGVNNFDLSDYRNIFVDDDGNAVLFDWNGNMDVGEPLYDPEAAFSILPPEAWLEHVHVPNPNPNHHRHHNEQERHIIRVSSIHAVDVWEVGIVLANILFQPCQWASHHCYSEDSLLRATIRVTSQEGNAKIPVNDEIGDVDLAEMIGMKKEELYLTDSFTPILCDGEHHHKKCQRDSFPILDNMTKEKNDQALDLLQSMLRFSPKDRPDCATLLKHPFFQS